ncbi:MAG: molecular chaperone TorD family protein [Nitrospirota bacterium]
MMIEALKEELYLYNHLRHLFLKEPTKEILNEIGNIEVSPENNDDVVTGLRLIVDSVKKNEDYLDKWIEDLAVEYARLFIGPANPPAPPYASFYLSESHFLMTDETIEVRKKYLEAGLSVKELYSVPDDHIGIELEFIYYLTGKTIESFEKGEREEASRFFEIRSDFIREHFSRWVPEFINNILNFTTEDLYRGSAILLRGCL